MPNPGHVSVLTAPAVTFLAPQRGGFFLDCTVGGGGHSPDEWVDVESYVDAVKMFAVLLIRWCGAVS